MYATGKSTALTAFVGLLAIFFISLCNSSPHIEIRDVRITSDKTFITTEVNVKNRTSVDLNFTVVQELIGHTMYINIHLKTETNGQFRTLKRWKNLDVCRFLDGQNRDVILDFLFSGLMTGNASFNCPFTVGTYSVKDITMDMQKIPPIIPKARYKLFLEVSQMVGDDTKLFSLKIDANYSAD